MEKISDCRNGISDSTENIGRISSINEDSSVMKIQHPKLMALHDHWIARMRQMSFPYCADINPFDLKPFLGHLLILEIADEYAESRYRLFGSILANYLQVDLTGMRLKDIPLKQSQSIFLEYQNVLIGNSSLAVFNQAMIGGKLTRYEKLMLPLSSDEKPIAMILAAIYPFDDAS